MTAKRHSEAGVRAVVLAAGHGKRMKSTCPKVLHDILGKAVITRVLDALDALNFEHVHVVVGHQAQRVKDYLAKVPPKSSYDTHLQEPQLGTGHALQQVAPALKDFKGTLLVTVGDTPVLTEQTLQSFLEHHQNTASAISLMSFIVKEEHSYGRILRKADNSVLGIVEDKDASPQEKQIQEVNAAIYCLEWEKVKQGLDSLSNNNKQGEYYLTDLVGWAVKENLPVTAFVVEDSQELMGINSRLDLAQAIEVLRDRVAMKLATESGVTLVDPKSTWISPEVVIGPDTVIYPGCYLTGCVEIGSECRIGPNTQIDGPTKIGDCTTVISSLVTASRIGDNCRVGPFAHVREGANIQNTVRIGNFVEIKKSGIADNTNVSHLSYIGDSMLGAHVNIGAGTITANYDHVTKAKSSTVIKDGASTGCNSVLVAPIEIGQEAVVAAGSVVTKAVPDYALAVGRARQEIKENWASNKKRKVERERAQVK